jgi:hypothetical protein
MGAGPTVEGENPWRVRAGDGAEKGPARKGLEH